MKKLPLLLLACTLLSGTAAFAADEDRDLRNDENAQECATEAKAAIAKHTRKPLSAVSFFNGAGLGDGADSIQISTYLVQGRHGLYKVELDAEDCTVRNIEHIDN